MSGSFLRLHYRVVSALVLLLSAIVLAACGAPQKRVELKFAWPEPPEKPRFHYERTIFSSADIMGELTTQEKMLELATGQGRQGVALNKPYHVKVYHGKIHITDTVARHVLVLDVPNKRFYTIGEKDDMGKLVKPIGMAIDGSGQLYVADAEAKRIAMYDPDGNFIRDFGAGELARPSGVAVNKEGTRVFAVDTGGIDAPRENHSVAAYDVHSGQLLFRIGKRGGAEGDFNLPLAATMGPDGLLYVLDSGNFRVQVFDQDGNFIRKFGKVGRQFGDFARPKGIAVDPDNNVYVVDTAFSNFQIFTPKGRLLMFIGDRGMSGMPGKYQLPAGIDVDEDGRVYLTDQFFRKLDIFRPSYTPEGTGYLVTGEKAERTEFWDIPEADAAPPEPTEEATAPNP